MYNVNSQSQESGEETHLLPRNEDGHPRSLANPVEQRLASTQTFADGREAHTTSNLATMMHLLKGNIGTGILAMAYALSNAGLLVGTIGIPILGLLCVHCMHLLVICSKSLSRRKGCTSLDYQSTAEEAFALGPAKIQKFATPARWAVFIMLLITQFGFCCVYFLFVSKSIYEVLVSFYGSSPLSVTEIMALTLPCMIALNFIPDLKRLSPVSSCANVLQVIGLVVILCYVIPGPYSTELNVYTAPLEKLPLYFGTAIYAFEGIGVVLPLENAMKNPEAFGGLNGVLNTCMVIVASLYTAVGFYGYLKYGSSVKSSITFNLPKGCMSDMVRVLFAVAIFLSYPLQFQVPLAMISPSIKSKFHLERLSERKQLLIELCIRTALVSMTFVLAWVIPLLHLFIALVGAVASSSLALIFPPIIELATIWNTNISRTKFNLIVVKDTLLISIGLVGWIFGSYTAGNEIAKCIKHPTDPACQV